MAKRTRSPASLDLAADKAAEAQFFATRLRDELSDELAATRYLFNASANACYATLATLEAASAREDDLRVYVRQRVDALRADPTMRVVLESRNRGVHVGESGVRSRRLKRSQDGGLYVMHAFRHSGTPDTRELNVVSAALTSAKAVSNLVTDVQAAFPLHTRAGLLDEASLADAGLNVEDAEERLGFPRGWSEVAGGTAELRLGALAYLEPPPAPDPIWDEMVDRFVAGLQADELERFRRETLFRVETPVQPDDSSA